MKNIGLYFAISIFQIMNGLFIKVLLVEKITITNGSYLKKCLFSGILAFLIPILFSLQQKQLERIPGVIIASAFGVLLFYLFCFIIFIFDGAENFK